jgi:hypothetical protein
MHYTLLFEQVLHWHTDRELQITRREQYPIFWHFTGISISKAFPVILGLLETSSVQYISFLLIMWMLFRYSSLAERLMF